MTDFFHIHGELPSATSLTLLERVRAQDQRAWERLVYLYSPLVYRWCRQAGLQGADAADVGQEVFTAVAQSIKDFRRDRKGDTFRGWLYGITRNQLRHRAAPPGGTGVGGSSVQRRLQGVPSEEESGDRQSASAVLDQRVLHRRVVELVRDEFELRTWQAFWKVIVEGKTPKDAAADLGMTVNAVYLAKSRVLHRLREEFAALAEL